MVEAAIMDGNGKTSCVNGSETVYWHRELPGQAHARLLQEVLRLGGDYAHVLDEFIDSRHDDVTGETWLHGRFTYMLYRRPVNP